MILEDALLNKDDSADEILPRRRTMLGSALGRNTKSYCLDDEVTLKKTVAKDGLKALELI